MAFDVLSLSMRRIPPFFSFVSFLLLSITQAFIHGSMDKKEMSIMVFFYSRRIL